MARFVVHGALACCIALGAFGFASRIAAAEPSHSQWVYPGGDGKLVYRMTAAGDRIMDYSTAGYGGGTVPLPNYAALGFTPDRIVNVAPVVGGADSYNLLI